MYAKFRNFPLRINKALGIFRKRVTTQTTTTTTTRTTVVGIRDAFQSPKIKYSGSHHFQNQFIGYKSDSHIYIYTYTISLLGGTVVVISMGVSSPAAITHSLNTVT